MLDYWIWYYYGPLSLWSSKFSEINAYFEDLNICEVIKVLRGDVLVICDNVLHDVACALIYCSLKKSMWWYVFHRENLYIFVSVGWNVTCAMFYYLSDLLWFISFPYTWTYWLIISRSSCLKENILSRRHNAQSTESKVKVNTVYFGFLFILHKRQQNV